MSAGHTVEIASQKDGNFGWLTITPPPTRCATPARRIARLYARLTRFTARDQALRLLVTQWREEATRADHDPAMVFRDCAKELEALLLATEFPRPTTPSGVV